MIIAPALVLGLLVAWALGAHLGRLADIKLRAGWLVFAALAVQLTIFTSFGAHVPEGLHRPLHMVSYVLLLAFIAVNVRVPGFWLAGVGVTMNVVVIFANRGYMPTTLEAFRTSGGPPRLIQPTGHYLNNVLIGPHTPLWWLGDLFPLPTIIPLSNAVSLGDILMLFGVVAFVYRACTDRIESPPRRLIEPLRVAAFRRMLAGRLVSGAGDWLNQAAVVTWIYLDTRSTTLVSAFLVVRMLSYMLGGLASAPLLDRIPGFRALSFVELSRGAATAAMIPFALTGQVWTVVALGGMSSFLASATNPSATSLVPELLPSDALAAGNALHAVARSVTMILGAIGAGILVSGFGIGTALTVDVLTFAAAVVLYRRFAGEPQPRAAERPGSRLHMIRQIRCSGPVCALTFSFAIATAAAGLLNASFSNVFDARFGDANAYGYALAAIGAGYACGELMTGLMRRQTLARRSVAVAFLASAALVWTLSHSTSVTTAYLLLFLLGAADGTTEVVRDTLIQLYTAPSIRAAVFAVSGSIQMGGMIAGLAAAPVLLGSAGTGTLLRVAAAAMVASAVVAGIGLATRGRGDELLAAPRGSDDLEVTVVRRTLAASITTGDEPAPARPGAAG